VRINRKAFQSEGKLARHHRLQMKLLGLA